MIVSSEIALRKFAFMLPLLVLTSCSSLNTGKTTAPAVTDPLTARSVSNTVLAPMGSGILGAALAQFAVADRRLAIEAEYKALEYAPKGQAVSWKSRSGKAGGEVVAAQPYQVGSQNCRQYSHNYTLDGAPQMVRGTACRNSDGSWTPLT